MLTAIKKDDIPDYDPSKTGRGRYPGWPMNTLTEFLDSGLEAAVVERPERSTKQVYASLKKAQERKKFPLNIVIRRGVVYLIRKEG